VDPLRIENPGRRGLRPPLIEPVRQGGASAARFRWVA
jgi:hypothetical protein